MHPFTHSIKQAVVVAAAALAALGSAAGVFALSAGTALAPNGPTLGPSGPPTSTTGSAVFRSVFVRTQSLSLAAGAWGTTIATCPTGRVVGGGVGTTSAVVDGRVQVSGPLDATRSTFYTDDGDVARSWKATIRNGASPATYKVFAICSETSDATVEETTVASSGGMASAVAKCPSGRRVVGGGIGVIEDLVRTEVLASGPLDATGMTSNTVDGDIGSYWYAQVRDPTMSQTYKVFALCASTSDAVVEATRFTQSSSGNSAACPTGRAALGGGVGFHVGSGLVSVSGPLDESGSTAQTVDGDVPRYWYAHVGSIAPGDTAVVFALCATRV
jgi:hypothetical protein